MPTRIQLATFNTWNDRLAHVYSTHGLEYTYVVYDKTHPLSENVKELYDNFQSAYKEEHLANATKWVISYGELDVGYRIRQSTADNINASLSSMEKRMRELASELPSSVKPLSASLFAFCSASNFKRLTKPAKSIPEIGA